MIPKSFFDAEVRDGFYVSSRMKRTWAATLEVFKAVEKVCVNHGIDYYADWGTALGAVRHGGFIPWDDDFDISMKREGFMRFLEYAPRELPEGYAILNMYTEPEYEELTTRIVNRKSVSFEPEYMEQYHGFPYIAGIDIFPLDYISNDSNKEESRRKIIGILKGFIDKYNADDVKLGLYKNDIKKFIGRLGFSIEEGKPIRQQLYIMIDKVSSMFGPEDGDTVVSMPVALRFNKKGDRVNCYNDLIRVPFEYTDIVIPAYYGEMLPNKYADYMRCIRNWDTHEYPVYLNIEQSVHSAGRTDIWPDYTYDLAKSTIKCQIDKKIQDKSVVVTSDNRETVFFLPYTSESWIFMEPLWLSLQEDESVMTVVMPIPYYEKDNNGKMREVYYEGDKLPDYVPVVGFDVYDLFEVKPDRIVIANSQDIYDASISIHPFFYSNRLKEVTHRLTYIPDFTLDEYSSKDGRAMYNMKFFCNMPGVINADEIIVQSDNMKDRFIDSLTGFAGDNSRELWETKIKTAKWEWPQTEGLGINEEDIPGEWWKKLLDKDGNGKKVVLYYTSYSLLLTYGTKYIEKTIYNLDTFEKKADSITIIWKSDYHLFEGLKERYPDIFDAFNTIRTQAGNKPNMIIDDNIDNTKAVEISDAFYGDGGVAMHAFERTGRPVMMQNVHR